jgi:hypothetical protein
LKFWQRPYLVGRYQRQEKIVDRRHVAGEPERVIAGRVNLEGPLLGRTKVGQQALATRPDAKKLSLEALFVVHAADLPSPKSEARSTKRIPSTKFKCSNTCKFLAFEI